MKCMTLPAAVLHFPCPRQQAILLEPTGLAQSAGYVWRRVFLKAVRSRER